MFYLVWRLIVNNSLHHIRFLYGYAIKKTINYSLTRIPAIKQSFIKNEAMKNLFLLIVFSLLFYACIKEEQSVTHKNTPFVNVDTSSQISTGILWDRIVPNLYLPAFAGNNEDTAAWGNITS
jgi:hypothetical protein